ncbi:type III secretion system outer membrane ring subunit SctC [Piscinibacter terrae]|uniref:Type 3 secretion system secretin n=1 Tax=Piscinibacter terrae TaxID=2496871 RepID=A0A3N7HGX3_9BURK|nr:type III secretion system outer membrane ring subunit SctC [Albitalea terrae]RQP21260.1 EscC/YscC/HrcC family type III secretion system outer membrane ring protein [Albitalea terrae]
MISRVGAAWPLGAWLHGWRAFAAALLLCMALPAQAMPIPFADRTVQLTAREQPIAGFLQDLFGLVDVPVNVSPSVKGAVNGNFSGPAERVWRNVSRAFNLVEYYDGVVLHIYAPSDMATRTLPIAPSLSAKVQRTVNEMRLPDSRNTVRVTREGTLVASGTRRFIEQVEEITRAQMVGDKVAPPSGFKVFYLRYAWAQDVSINFGGRSVVLPGVASIVRAMMTSNSRSQVAVASFEAPSRNTVPGLRGQRTGRANGTLGGPDADTNAPSAPTLAAAYASGALPGMVGAANASGTGTPVLSPSTMAMVLPSSEAQQVRVEADARLNAVIVRDMPERLSQYEQLIAALDVEPQALEIEATIIDVNTDKMRELGINWRYTKGRGSLLFGRGDNSDLLLTPTTPPGDITPIGKGGFISAVLGNANQFIARINALQEQGAAKVVSSPQVLTLSNVEAVFDNSSTFFVRVAGRDDVDLFNVSAGTTLRVTPHVFKDRGDVRIKMLVAIEDGSLSTRTVDTLPVVDRSSINTQALIFEGESLLVGGITRESSNDEATKVPVLGDVPVIGALFRSTSKSNSRVERMFLISPRLSSGRRVAVEPAGSRPAPPASAPGNSTPAPAPVAPAPVSNRGNRFDDPFRG